AARPAFAGALPDLSPLSELRQMFADSPLPAPPGWSAAAQPHRIVLHAGTRGGRKQWPLSRWREVAVGLMANPKNYLVFTGGPSEIEMANTLAHGLPAERVWVAAGSTSLRELGAILLQAGCLVAPDCGPAHLASALGCPTVVLMGATHPATCAPFWQPGKVLFHSLAPLPVEMAEMQGSEPHPNMLAIAVADVLAAVEEMQSAKQENV
ncbi:MAG: glycosyltransferase family 9 protein, partial [Planctomycetota bacterium]|nr:glycosyltransferase family 9 protein [Planctomycetota bacterium]